MSIQDATVTAIGTDDDGIRGYDNVVIDNATVIASGAQGLYASNGYLTINNSTVTATGEKYKGIWGEGAITITNSQVTATGEEYGIHTDNDFDNQEYDDLTIDNSTVIASGGNYGIWANYDITIKNGSTVTASATATGENACIYSEYGDIAITDATVYITTIENGIYADFGAITIDSATITDSGTGTGSYALEACTTITIKGTSNVTSDVYDIMYASECTTVSIEDSAVVTGNLLYTGTNASALTVADTATLNAMLCYSDDDGYYNVVYGNVAVSDSKLFLNDELSFTSDSTFTVNDGAVIDLTDYIIDYTNANITVNGILILPKGTTITTALGYIDGAGLVGVLQDDGSITYYDAYGTGDTASGFTASGELDFKSATGDVSGDGYQWDNGNKTLTITAAGLTVISANQGILLPADSTILLNGDLDIFSEYSSIECYGVLTIGNATQSTASLSCVSSYWSGFEIDGELLIQNIGDITVDAGESAFYSDDSSITINNVGNITVSSWRDGFYGPGDISIKGTGTITMDVYGTQFNGSTITLDDVDLVFSGSLSVSDYIKTSATIAPTATYNLITGVLTYTEPTVYHDGFTVNGVAVEIPGDFYYEVDDDELDIDDLEDYCADTYGESYSNGTVETIPFTFYSSGDYTGNITGNLSLSLLTIDFAGDITATSVTYGDTWGTIVGFDQDTYTATMSGAEVPGTYTLTMNGATYNSATIPDAGTYTWVVTFTSTDGTYKAVTVGSGSIVVGKATINDTTTKTQSATFTGEARSITAPTGTTVNGQTLSVSYDDATYTNAGTYYINYTLSAPNHNDLSDTITFTVASAESEGSITDQGDGYVTSGDNVVYGQTYSIAYTPAISVTRTATASNTTDAKTAELWYNDTKLDTETDIIYGGTAATFTFTVDRANFPATAFDDTADTFTIKWGGDDNLSASNTTMFLYLTAKDIDDVSVGTVDEKEYSGLAQTFENIPLTSTDVASSDDVTIAVDYTTTAATVGTYLVSGALELSGDDAGYYKAADSVVFDGSVSIVAKNVAGTEDFTASVVENMVNFTEPTFTGVNSETVSGSVTKYTYDSVEYTSYEALITELNKVTVTTSGETHTMGYTFTADGNYTGTIMGDLTLSVMTIGFTTTNGVTVASATYGDTLAEIFTFVESNFSATVGDDPVSGTYALYVNDVAYNGTTMLDAGTGYGYEVQFTSTPVDGVSVYENLSILTGAFDVAQRTVTYTWDDTTFDYTGSAPTLTATITNLASQSDSPTVTATTSETDVGTYTEASVLTDASGNYVLSGSDAGITFTISAATIAGTVAVTHTDTNDDDTVNVGDTLTADIAAITPAGGTPSYQWYKLASGVTTALGTDSAYTLADTDVSGKIYVTVTFSGNTTGSATSASVDIAKYALTGTATITNTDGVLTVDAPTNAGIAAADYTITWTGATTVTADSYTITNTDKGTTVSVAITATQDSEGFTGSITNSLYIDPTAPVFTAISASQSSGSVTISWTVENGGSAITGYALTMDGETVYTPVTTDTSYTVSDLSNGTAYSFVLTATNAVGDTDSDAVTATPVASSSGGSYTPSTGSSSSSSSSSSSDTSSTTTDTATSDSVTVETETSTTTNTDGSTTTDTVETATNTETGEVVTTTSTETSVENDDGTVTTEVASTATNETTGEVTSTTATSTTTTSDDGATVTQTTATTTNETTGAVTESSSVETVTDTTITVETVAQTTTSTGDVIAQTTTVITDTETATELTATVASENGETVTAEIVATATDDTTAVTIPQAVLETVASESAASITVETPVATIQLSEVATDTVAAAMATSSATDVVISATVAESSVVAASILANLNNVVVVDLTITVGGETLSSFNGGTVTVSIPYTPTNANAPITVYYVADDGTISLMDCTYDAENGVIVFETSHFSYYMVGEGQASVFTDVALGAYYYTPVLWAVENGITSGTTDTTFSPTNTCTRAQAVTFLWRAIGEVTATGDAAFSALGDVADGSYYYDAVMWAVENGITSGTTASTFSPNSGCTRGQIVTFLWRLAGCPMVSGEAMSDVTADSYCYDAVLWAVSEGITTGYADGTFGANTLCTRGQIVTFLYRYLAD